MGALVDIAAVALADPLPGELRDGFLDRPRAGAVLDAHCVDVLGWALGAEAPALAVEFALDGDAFWQAPLAADRRDVAAEFPQSPEALRAGFATSLNLVGKRPELEVGVWIALAGGERAPLATIQGRRRWRRERSPTFADLVSVVIPRSDGSPSPEAAVESVRSQTYPRVELVLIEEGAAESAAEARNLGIRSSNGDYLLFLEPDRALAPEAVEAGVAALASQPACAAAFADPPAPALYRRSLFEHVRGFDPALGAEAAAELDRTVAAEFAVCASEAPSPALSSGVD